MFIGSRATAPALVIAMASRATEGGLVAHVLSITAGRRPHGVGRTAVIPGSRDLSGRTAGFKVLLTFPCANSLRPPERPQPEGANWNSCLGLWDTCPQAEDTRRSASSVGQVSHNPKHQETFGGAAGQRPFDVATEPKRSNTCEGSGRKQTGVGRSMDGGITLMRSQGTTRRSAEASSV